MDRVELLAAMKRASGALALRDDAPAFASFFFDGEWICAYGDEIAITARCELPVQGGIIGKVVLAWAGACNGSQVESECEGDEVKLVCGQSKITLPLLPPEQLVFEPPPADAGVMFYAPFELMEMIERCSPYVGDDPTHPWRMGLTLRYDQGAFDLYSTTDVVLCHAFFDDENIYDHFQTIIPSKFVSLLRHFSQTKALAGIHVGAGWIEATFEDETTIFARTNHESDANAYEQVMRPLFNDATFTPVANIALNLQSMMDRVTKVGVATGQDRASLEVRGRSIAVTLSGGSASLADSLPFPGKHADIRVEIMPSSMLSILPHVKEMAVTDRAVLLTGSGFEAAIAAVVV